MCKINLSSTGSPNYVCLTWHPNHKEYEEILNLFNARSIDFHPEYDSHLITHLSDDGILLHFMQENPEGLPRYTIRALVNPKKVLDSETDYAGLMPGNEDSFHEFKDRFKEPLI